MLFSGRPSLAYTSCQKAEQKAQFILHAKKRSFKYTLKQLAWQLFKHVTNVHVTYVKGLRKSLHSLGISGLQFFFFPSPRYSLNEDLVWFIISFQLKTIKRLNKVCRSERILCPYLNVSKTKVKNSCSYHHKTHKPQTPGIQLYGIFP